MEWPTAIEVAVNELLMERKAPLRATSAKDLKTRR